MHEFASHWGRDGLKPYHRYSFAGGTDATQENVSAADNTWSNKLSDLKQDTSYLHLRLYQEQPPNDGHRKTSRAAAHTLGQSELTGRSLACGLEQQDSRGNGNVEGFDGAMHGNPHDLSSASRFNIGKPR